MQLSYGNRSVVRRLRSGIRRGALINTERNCGLYKMRGISSLTQELLEFQEGIFESDQFRGLIKFGFTELNFKEYKKTHRYINRKEYVLNQNVFLVYTFLSQFPCLKCFITMVFFLPSMHEVSLKRISSISPVSHLDRFLCTSKPNGLPPLVFFQLTVPVLRTSVSSGMCPSGYCGYCAR